MDKRNSEDRIERVFGKCATCGTGGEHRFVHGRLICEECWRTAKDVFKRGKCERCGSDSMRLYTRAGYLCRTCVLHDGEALIDFGNCEQCGKVAGLDQMADDRWLCSACSQGVLCET